MSRVLELWLAMEAHDKPHMREVARQLNKEKVQALDGEALWYVRMVIKATTLELEPSASMFTQSHNKTLWAAEREKK